MPLNDGWLRAERLGRFVRELWIVCPGFDVQRLSLADAGAGTGETLRLRPARAWVFELVDAMSGEPIPGGALEVGMDASSDPDLPSATSVQLDDEVPGLVEENRIRLESPWLRWTERWILRVSAPGYASWERETTASEMRAGPDVIRVPLARP